MSITLDQTLCTGCAVCAEHCPRGAIERRIANEQVAISINYAQCDYCGECESKCPREALTIDRGGRDKEGSVILYRGEMARCRSCGTCFAPAALIEYFRSMLSDREEWVVDSLYLCPACKDEHIGERLMDM